MSCRKHNEACREKPAMVPTHIKEYIDKKVEEMAHSKKTSQCHLDVPTDAKGTAYRLYCGGMCVAIIIIQALLYVSIRMRLSMYGKAWASIEFDVLCSMLAMSFVSSCFICAAQYLPMGPMHAIRRLLASYEERIASKAIERYMKMDEDSD